MSTSGFHPSYSRAPSDALKALLRPTGFLAPLLQLQKRSVAGLPLDVHLRRHDEVHVYCGLTRILKARRNRNGFVSVSAHQAYSHQDCAKAILRVWSIAEGQEFERDLDAYVSQVWVHERHTGRERFIQATWSRIEEPWTPFDREAVLGYSTKLESNKARKFRSVDRARLELVAIAEHQQDSMEQNETWAMPGVAGREVDQLAVDAEGRLVLIELKSSSATPSAVYYSPFQLLQYIWEWHSALPSVLVQLQQLIDARAEFGLTVGSISRLSGGLPGRSLFRSQDRERAV